MDRFVDDRLGTERRRTELELAVWADVEDEDAVRLHGAVCSAWS